MKTEEMIDFVHRNAPCYLYDRGQITERCAVLREALPGAALLYSVKANPFAPVVRTIAAQGFGADAASAEEVLLAGREGIPAEKIFYSAPGKTERDLEKAWGRCTFIADSFSELERLETLAAERGEQLRVGVRVNPSFSMGGAAALPSKFGIDEEQLTSSAWGYPHLTLGGIHVHLRSQVLDTDMLCAYYRDCLALAERIGTLPGAEMAFINFGSGIGTVYDALREKPLAFEKIAETVRDLRRRSEAELLFETGRFLVCNAGTYYARVTDRKVSRGKTFLVAESGMNGFLRPAVAELLRQNLGEFPSAGQEPLYTSATQCAFRVLGREGELERVDIVGSLCTALDVLARDILLPRAEIGDILAVSNAGSYGCTLSPQLFSSHEPPKEFLWE